MDMKTSFAAQTYAQARTAAAPKPGSGETGGGVGQFANTFAEALNNHEATARAAMTANITPSVPELAKRICSRPGSRCGRRVMRSILRSCSASTRSAGTG